MSTISSKNLEAITTFYDWMHTTGRARIIKFTENGPKLRSLFDSDTKSDILAITKSTSSLIEQFKNVSAERKQYFVENSSSIDWNPENPDLYICYRLFKMLWLTLDIQKNGIQSPLQLYQNGRNYLSHPGSDKKFAITYLKPLDDITCFYIWYPELDQTPWHWTIPHSEINTPEEFISLFVKSDDPTFKFFNVDVNITTQGWKHNGPAHMDPWASGLWLTCKKTHKWVNDKFNYTIPTISYTDAVHRHGMEKELDLFYTIDFNSDKSKFFLGEFKFLYRNGYWLPNIYTKNIPKSIIDEGFIFKENFSLTIQNKKSATPLYRPWA